MATQLGTKGQPAADISVKTVVYVYAITPVRKKAMAAPRFGVDGLAPVVPVQVGDVICWVSYVDAVEFGIELSDRMENIEWLANAGVRHQQVVAALAEHNDVLPARFGTVFSSESLLISDIRRRKRSISAVLKRVAGSDEWGVKVFAEPIKPVTTDSEAASSGREYLQRKAAVLVKKGERKSDPELSRFAAALRKTAAAATTVGKVSGGQRNLMWQAAFLVKRGSRTRFNQVLRQFASKWSGEKTIECTGPWPPYSFVSRDGR